MVSGINLKYFGIKISSIKFLVPLYIMKKSIRYIVGITALLVIVLLVNTEVVQAQCAMCSLTAQNATENGNVQGKGLNNGILFLLAMPYLAALVIGGLWYRNYRTKKTVRIDEDHITLN